MPIFAPDTKDLELGQSQIQPADTYARPMGIDPSISENAARARQNGDELFSAFNQLGHTIQSVSAEIGQIGERIGEKQQAEADKEAQQNMDYLVETVHQDIANGGPKAAQSNPALTPYSPSVQNLVANRVGNDDGYSWALGRFQEFYKTFNASGTNTPLDSAAVRKFTDGMMVEAYQATKDNPGYAAGYLKQVRSMAEKINAMSTEQVISFMKSKEGASYLDDVMDGASKVEFPTSPPSPATVTPPRRPEDLEHIPTTPEKGKEKDAQAETRTKVASADAGSISDANNDIRRTSGYTRAAPPASPYEASLVNSYAGKSNGESQECVALVKQATNVGHTSDWKPGGALDANTPVGTAIATFGADGRYKNKPGESHAAIYLGPGQSPGSIKVLDQWNGHSAGVREIKPGTGPEGAEKFQVINGKSGVAQARATDDGGGKRPFGVPQGYGQSGYAQQSYDPVAIIAKFEGFRETPYWDVNAHRVGYGSDTITRADGTVVKVTPGMTVTEADARRDLQRRVGEFQGGIQRDIGADAWARLPDGAKAALTSIAYNYGSISKIGGLVEAAKAGDLNHMAQIVASQGTNHSRRLKEAAMIMGGGEGSPGFPTQTAGSTVQAPTKVVSEVSGVSYNVDKARPEYEALGVATKAASDAIAAQVAEKVGGGKAGDPLSPIGNTQTASNDKSPQKLAMGGDTKNDASNDVNLKVLTTARENAKALNAAGVEVSGGASYSALTFGVEAAKKIYKAKDGAKASEVVGKEVLAKHPELKRMSVAEVKQWAANKVGDRVDPLTATHNATRKVDSMFGDISSLSNQYRRDLLAKEIVKRTTETGDPKYLDYMPPEWMNDSISAEFAQARRQAMAIKDAQWSHQQQLKKQAEEETENSLKQGINEKLIKGEPISEKDYRNPDGSINNKALDYARSNINNTLIPQAQSAAASAALIDQVTNSVATNDYTKLGFENGHTPSQQELIQRVYRDPNIRPEDKKEVLGKLDVAMKVGNVFNLPEIKEGNKHSIAIAAEYDRQTAKDRVGSMQMTGTLVSYAEIADKIYKDNIRRIVQRETAANGGALPNSYDGIIQEASDRVKVELADRIKLEEKRLKDAAEEARGIKKPNEPSNETYIYEGKEYPITTTASGIRTVIITHEDGKKEIKVIK